MIHGSKHNGERSWLIAPSELLLSQSIESHVSKVVYTILKIVIQLNIHKHAFIFFINTTAMFGSKIPYDCILKIN